MRALLALILAVPPYVAIAQQRPARDAAESPARVIRGQVRSDDDSAALLRKARVTATGTRLPAVFTDQDGLFEIAVPESTTSPLRISKPGFAPAHIALRTTLPTDLLQIRLARGAAVNGRVIDELGGPAVGVAVRVRRLLDATERGDVPINTLVESDDFGEFRVGSLPAGTYELFVDGTEKPPDSAALSAPTTSVRLRAGEEGHALLFHAIGEAEARAAAAFVRTQQTEQRAAVPVTVRFNPRGTAVISGRVTAPDGRGIPGAIVRLNPTTAGSAQMVASTAQGLFTFFDVRPGAYRVVATKTGFVAGEYGQQRVAQPGRVVTVRDRQRLDDADIGLWRGATVTGTVTDADGEPLEGLAMHVWRLRYWNGRRIAEGADDVAVARTDDRGSYRLHGLQPGTYYVVATDDPALSTREVTSAPRSYYPGVPTLSEASTIHVDAGVDAAGLHLTFAPATTRRVAGLAMDSEGVRLQRPLVLAGSTRAGVALAPQIASMSGFAFSFDHVPPGSYVIYAIQRRESDDTVLQEFARQVVAVADDDVTSLRVITAKGSTVSGTIVAEGDRSAVSRLPFAFEVVSGDPDFAPPPGQYRPWTVRITGFGFFQVDGLSGPIRFTSRDAPAGWFLRSAAIGGRNAADEPVVFGTPNDVRGGVNVVFSNAGGEIAGRVVDGRNEPVRTYVAVAFPVNRTRWYLGSRYVKLARPDEEGRFTLGMLPPEDYWVAAVDALFNVSLDDPELLARLSSVGQRVSLSAGERLATDLRLVTLPPP